MRGVSVLADPTRAAILRMMLAADDGRVLVGRAADTLGLRQPTVSHHMKALLDEGIVTRAPSGRIVWYAIAPDQHDRVATLLRAAHGDRERRLDLARIIDDLVTRFEGRLDRGVITRTVTETHALLARTSHPRHLASRTAAFAAQRLEDAAPSDDGAAPTVLFVCVQNAGRSQIAAAILRHLAGDRVRVRTAGSAPADDLRGAIVETLDEIGIPIGGEFPKPLTGDVVDKADVVVTMGCGDVCTVRAGASHLDWAVDDPVGQSLGQVRSIRDDIDQKVRRLLAELQPVSLPVHRPL
jgi:arsenate reductase